MKKISILFLLMALVYHGIAQFSDSVTYYTGLSATGIYNKTNDGGDVYNFNNALKLSIRKKSISLNSTSKWIYGKQDDVLTNNDVSSSLDFNLYKTLPHFYYWGLANYNKSYSLKLNDQYQAGLGIAYNIIDRPNATFNLSDGLIYEYSDITLSDTTRDLYSTMRNSFRISFKWDIKNLLFLNGTGFLQNSLNYGNDYIIKSDVGLGIKIRKWLSLTTSFSYNKVSKTRRENVFVTYGINIEKYF